jgi:undecaprenyl-diphosphatase
VARPTLPVPVSRRVAAFDAGVERAFDRLRGNPLADRVFYGASALGDHSLVWLLLGTLRGLRSERDRRAAVRLGLALGLESALVNVGIKSLFRRTRPPWELERPLRLRRPRTSSFPSGHATSAFTAAGLLSDQDRLWPLYYALAALVASSRVHVKIHHASDVLAGVAVGIALGRLGRRLSPLPHPPAPSVGPPRARPGGIRAALAGLHRA